MPSLVRISYLVSDMDTIDPLRAAATPPTRPNRSRRASLPSWALLLGCLLVALLLGAPVPDPRLTTDLRSDQGELSWEAVTLDAIARHARFGVDVAYTFGPLADVYIDQYHPAVWPRARLAKVTLLLLLGAQAWWITTIAPGRPWRRGLACLLLVLPASQMNNDVIPDGLFIAAATLAPLAYVARPLLVTQAASAVVCAYLSLAKFSFAPLYGVAVLLPLLVEQRRRRGMLLSAASALVMPALWLAAGQRIGDLTSFARTSAQLAGGYGPAMALESSAMWAQLVMAVPLLVAVVPFGAFSTLAGSVRQRAGFVLLLGAAGYLAFKAGFTRHDEHVWIVFVWLASIGLPLALLSRLPRALVLAFGLLFGAFAVRVERTIDAPYRIDGGSLTRQWHQVSAAFVTPAATMAAIDRQYAVQRERVRALPLSALVRKWSPADVDTRNQIPALFAGDAASRLRPVFQSAAAYTAALAGTNRRYLADLPAGATMIIESWTYDDRFPGLQQSGAWDLLLRDFEIVAHAPPYVVLRKTPARALACDEEVKPGRLGEFLELPAPPDGAVVMAAPDLRRTLWGRVRQFVFRDARVVIDSRDNTTVEEDRYVVAMGTQGFLLQPSVRVASDLPSVWDSRAPRAPTHVRIRTVERLRSYASDFTWRIQVCRRAPGT